MASILDFLPIITILAVGAGIWQLISKFGPGNLRKTEYFTIFLMLGSLSLIIPLAWIGIQPGGILAIFIGNNTIELIDFWSWCLLYFLLGLIIVIIAGYFIIRILLRDLEHFQLEFTTFKDYRFILLGLLLLDYFVLELILPLRGFDALYYYFPEAEVFAQAERITEINYLSFLPVVKSPLNVLLYVYSYYVTGELAIQLIPFLFLLGLVILVYDFSMELFDNKSIAMIAAIFILVLPFTYWLMNYWAFYQDLYLCYFFSVTCYFSLKLHKSPSNKIFAVLMCMGMIGALLTKITAWVLPIILLIWLPTGSKEKIIRVAIILILGLFLCVQAATRIFIGVTLPIIVSLGVMVYIIRKEKVSQYHSRTLIQLIPIGAAIAIGSFWLTNRMSLSKSVWNGLYELYFQFSQLIQWFYPLQSLDPLLHTLESVHRINFFSATGILLVGTAFVLPWLILKIFALRVFGPITAPLIWILSFFCIWCTYYLDGSMRYLAPIIIPFILCISWGFYQLTLTINNKAKQEFMGVLFAFLGCFNIYYLIPLESLTVTNQTQEVIGLSYNQAALNYYSLFPFPFLLIRILLTLCFSFLVFFYINKELTTYYLNVLMKKINLAGISKLYHYLIPPFTRRTNIRWVSKLLVCGIIIIPLVVQSYLLLNVEGDLARFHSIHEYEYRTEYQEIVTIIQQQNQPFAAILTVRTPGLQFFTRQPVIDIYYQRQIFPSDPFFQSTNLTEIIEVLRNPLNHTLTTDFEYDLDVSIRFIVVPSSNNIYYNNYLEQIKSTSHLFQSLENETYFNLLFGNSDFRLFEVIS